MGGGAGEPMTILLLQPLAYDCPPICCSCSWSHVAVSIIEGPFLGVLEMRALLFGFHSNIRCP